ncbi:hypothetical protein PHYBOEH_005791 [Phytophthora boehmeriae]|uniref:Uncharacterized protein n=1 Tax=Phytophthora boehmeriae TaxID=109152 RepID=A0A8T1X3U2_9STRA|nr:hypothetical protein PHYBOEH_005791 [Phytophthora boehmeriae]
MQLSVDPPTADLIPWERHLRDIYEGRADETDGLKFFSTRGYYDADESSNAFEKFRERVGLDASWFESATDAETDEEKEIKRIMQSSADLAPADSSSDSKLTPWENHLQAIYDAPIDEYFHGLSFFATHGYYDTDNSAVSPVQELLESFGLEFLYGEFW